jgi:hypothetical protein
MIVIVGDEETGVSVQGCVNVSGSLTLEFTRPVKDGERIGIISADCLTGEFNNVTAQDVRSLFHLWQNTQIILLSFVLYFGELSGETLHL